MRQYRLLSSHDMNRGIHPVRQPLGGKWMTNGKIMTNLVRTQLPLGNLTR